LSTGVGVGRGALLVWGGVCRVGGGEDGGPEADSRAVTGVGRGGGLEAAVAVDTGDEEAGVLELGRKGGVGWLESGEVPEI